MALVPATRLNGRFTVLALLALLLIGTSWILVPSFGIEQQLESISWSRPVVNAPRPPPEGLTVNPNHPIDYLIRSATLELDELIAKNTSNLHDAAQAYRDRRGRQPPPSFDKWFAFAQKSDALIVEDFFDRIYHDLEPFWGVSAKHMRESANTFASRISVRDGKADYRTSGGQPEWPKQWTNLLADFAEYLPDVDMALNEMDEPRMIVEWEEINDYMERAASSRRIVPEQRLKEQYQKLTALDEDPPEKYDPQFTDQGHYWEKAVVGCAPESPARNEYIEKDFSSPPPLTGEYPQHSHEGYVRNWTLAKSSCDNPHLQGLHGTFIEPLSMRHTRRFWPLFGGSKLSVNNEILLPAAMYWTDDPFYSGGDEHGEAWRRKKDMIVWRGAASGGRNRENNWKRFPRHRFLSMVNATTVYHAETHPDETPLNFVLPADNAYRLAALSEKSEPGDLSRWIYTWSNAAFVHLLCFPPQERPHGRWCKYTDPYFTVEQTIPMKDMYDYKYLPDIDGNSYSGRYRGFLGSTSMPIKATIYQEWHDSRLIPWKHFVPMDNTFIDVYGIMEYFLGNIEAGVGGHDEVARDIAISGKRWAEKVLRKEDMQIYVFRLLLEYARLCDDDREILGWREPPDGNV